MAIPENDVARLQNWLLSEDIALTDEVLRKINQYYDLLRSWSQKISLISRNDRDHIIENHVIDSLGVLKLIPSTGKIIDIGSGAGFPGIPLALLRPQATFALLESIHKKSVFLNAVIQTLGLRNTVVIEKRLEDLRVEPMYDIATVRALPRWNEFLPYIKKIMHPDGKIVLFEKRGIYRIL